MLDPDDEIFQRLVILTFCGCTLYFLFFIVIVVLGFMFVVVGVCFWGVGGWLKGGEGVQLHQLLGNSCIFISDVLVFLPVCSSFSLYVKFLCLHCS